MRAISAYIAPARGAALGAADGTVLSWRLSNAITEANAKFVSSAWHQDRCGRQLKLFVFTHDVDEERGRPTRVAAGSHPTFHYSSLYCVYTRYDDAWIRAWIRPPTGYGRAEADGAFARDVGGRKREAYVVDTNALHSATADGAFARDVVSVRFNVPGKCKALARPEPPETPFYCACDSSASAARAGGAWAPTAAVGARAPSAAKARAWTGRPARRPTEALQSEPESPARALAVNARHIVKSEPSPPPPPPPPPPPRPTPSGGSGVMARARVRSAAHRSAAHIALAVLHPCVEPAIRTRAMSRHEFT